MVNSSTVFVYCPFFSGQFSQKEVLQIRVG